MKRRTKRSLFLALVALLSLWLFADVVGPALIVTAPSSAFEPVVAPAGFTTLEAAGDGARLRAWVSEPQGPTRGTLVLLHGIRGSKEMWLQEAAYWSAVGVRCLLVDARGHGESSGAYLSYGVRESEDVRALVDALAEQGQMVEPLIVMGSSYGAATAIQYAAIDPRVEGTVAIAPFASLPDVVLDYLRWGLGPFAAWVPSALVERVLTRTEQIAEFAPEDACPLCASATLETEMLLVHSLDDERIPASHSERIQAAALGEVDLLLVEGVSHVNTRFGEGAPATIDAWLNARFQPER